MMLYTIFLYSKNKFVPTYKITKQKFKEYKIVEKLLIIVHIAIVTADFVIGNVSLASLLRVN